MLTRNKKRELLEIINNYDIRKNMKPMKIPKTNSNINLISDISNSDSEFNSESVSSSDSEFNSESDISNSESVSELDSEFNSDKDLLLQSFDVNIASIINGNFFNFYPENFNYKSIKSKYSIKTIETLNLKLDSLRSQYIIDDANIDNILQKNIPDDIKLKILEKIYLIINTDILSSDYNFYIKELKELLYYSKSDDLLQLENKINNVLDLDNSGLISLSYKNKILKSDMDFNNKVTAYKYMKIIESYNDQSSEELSKYKTWLNTLLTIPFNKYYSINGNSINGIQNYLINVRKILDKNLAFLDYPKDQIINILAQLIRNPNSQINAIGLYGNKGIGKTHFIESIAEALNRPLVRISVGSNSDVHTLKGHNFTYIGSKQGKIIDGLIKSKVMNPIIFFDEIDKIAKNNYGSDITGFLIHLIDLTTNNKFNSDDYFSEIEFDLSRALFLFTYNDPELVDPILADRLYKIKINNYTKQEKIYITTTHLINTILQEFNFTTSDIIISHEIITEIVYLSNDLGMRSIKKNLHTIISRLNVLLLLNPDNNIITLKYYTLYKYYNKLPIVLQKQHINLLLDHSDKDNSTSFLNLYT